MISPVFCKHLGEFVIQRNFGVRFPTCTECGQEFIAVDNVVQMSDALEKMSDALQDIMRSAPLQGTSIEATFGRLARDVLIEVGAIDWEDAEDED